MTNPQDPDPTWQQPGGQPQPPYGQPQPYDPIQYQQPYGQTPYGQPVYGQPVYARPTNSLAIASLVCSLAGLLILISAPVGAILGHIARKQIAESGEQGDGMALAGIIVGWVLTGLGICGCVAYLGLLATIFGTASVS